MPKRGYCGLIGHDEIVCWKKKAALSKINADKDTLEETIESRVQDKIVESTTQEKSAEPEIVGAPSKETVEVQLRLLHRDLQRYR